MGGTPNAILWGKNLWGGGGALTPDAGAELDAVNSALDVLYRLGFRNTLDITSTSWVTPAELFAFADEAAKRLAYQCGLFLTYDTSITVTPGTAVWALPATHVFTLAAWLGAQALRLTTVRELAALDGNWPTTTGATNRASLDAGSVGTITLYPIPGSGGTLAQVCQEYPAQIVAGASVILLPTVLQDYFSYAMLAGARGKESDMWMPEMAEHYKQRLALYDQVIEHLWGPGQ